MNTGNWGFFWEANLGEGCAFAWAAAALLLPELVQFLWQIVKGWGQTPTPSIWVRPFFVGLLNGEDGRWSTSKTSAFLWTYAVAFAFITWIVWKGSADITAGGGQIGEQYLVLLGIPAGTAVIAKGVTQSQLDGGTIIKPPSSTNAQGETQDTTNPIEGLTQLITDDRGKPDLLDFQYFLFNTILLGYFLEQFLSHPEKGLPSLPDSLVALSGVAASAYVAKKAVTRDAPPTIRSIIPDLARSGSPITIYGTGFSPDGQTPSVKIGGRRSPNVVLSSSPTGADSVTATVPQGLAAPAGSAAKQVDVTVVPGTGVESQPAKLTVTP